MLANVARSPCPCTPVPGRPFVDNYATHTTASLACKLGTAMGTSNAGKAPRWEFFMQRSNRPGVNGLPNDRAVFQTYAQRPHTR